jgi:hypothetical protein
MEIEDHCIHCIHCTPAAPTLLPALSCTVLQHNRSESNATS